MKKNWILITFICIVVAVVVVFYTREKFLLKVSEKDTKPQDLIEVTNEGQDNPVIKDTENGKTFSNSRFSYTCPKDWSLYENKNYNGSVTTSECSKTYVEQIAFDDGVSLTIGFVPQNIADTYEWAGEKWSTTLLNDVKNETNAESYSNNNFIGWISMKNEKHTLSLIAQYQVSNGYYEVSALAMGDSKKDREFRKMLDDIISTIKMVK